MLAHFCQKKPGLPARYEELRRHAAAMNICFPRARPQTRPRAAPESRVTTPEAQFPEKGLEPP
jgi:hypothetical protein